MTALSRLVKVFFVFKTKVGGDRSSGRGWRRLRAPAARLDRHACPHMSLVVVTVSSSSNSFAFAQPVRGLYSAEQLRRVRDGACDWTGRDAQRRRRGGDGETLALFHAARVACAHIVDVVEALWWIDNDTENDLESAKHRARHQGSLPECQ